MSLLLTYILYPYVHICACLHTYVYSTHAHVHVCTTHAHVHVHTHMHTHKHKHVYSCTHVHVMCTCTIIIFCQFCPVIYPVIYPRFLPLIRYVCVPHMTFKTFKLKCFEGYVRDTHIPILKAILKFSKATSIYNISYNLNTFKYFLVMSCLSYKNWGENELVSGRINSIFL
jgi:hypothetical protein